MSKEKILVSGANGATGKIIINLLKNHAEYQPVAMIRKQKQKDFFENQNVLTLVADLEEDISHSVQGIDKVIFAAGSKGTNVIGVDQNGAIKLIEASKKEGVKKFVMLSSMGADNPSVSEDLQEYLEAKQVADKHLAESGLKYSIVRPGTLTDKDGTDKIELKTKLSNFGKIPRADVAKTLVEVLNDDVKTNKIFEIISGDTSIKKALH